MLFRSIRAATFDGDQRGEPTELTGIVCNHLELATIREAPRVVYHAGFERNRISLLAPLVAETADAGDLIAARILTEAGRSIGLIALGVLRQLFEPDDAVDIYMTGGVFNIGARITEPMNEMIVAEWPNAVTREPRFPPAVGAVIVAARSFGIAVDDAFLNQIAASLPSVT